MATFSVKRQTTIAAPPARVFGILRDFRSWPSWSPWLIAEPNCRVSFPDGGRSYAWEGAIVGSGSIEVVGEEPDRRIDHQLHFIKPWKSEARVAFELAPDGDGTRVEWSMEGSLPFFMFWMTRTMAAHIGGDYERGLAMLKDFIETGSVPSKLEFSGPENFAATPYVGIHRNCAMEEMGQRISGDIGRLHEWAGGKSLAPAGPPFTICHRWDPVRRRLVYTVGLPLDPPPQELDPDLIRGEIPACRTYRVRHTGPYRHIGNSWASAMMHHRARQFDPRRGIHPFEVYENDPADTPEDELVTTVHMAAR